MTESDPTLAGSCACSEVCSLPPDALRDRLATIRSEFAPQGRRRETLRDGLAWEFGAEMREKLEALVALERECCSGLDWRIVGAPGGCVRVEVRGLDARSAAPLRAALGPAARGAS